MKKLIALNVVIAVITASTVCSAECLPLDKPIHIKASQVHFSSPNLVLGSIPSDALGSSELSVLRNLLSDSSDGFKFGMVELSASKPVAAAGESVRLTRSNSNADIDLQVTPTCPAGDDSCEKANVVGSITLKGAVIGTAAQSAGGKVTQDISRPGAPAKVEGACVSGVAINAEVINGKLSNPRLYLYMNNEAERGVEIQALNGNLTKNSDRVQTAEAVEASSTGSSSVGTL